MVQHPLLQIPSTQHDAIPMLIQTQPTPELTRHQIQLQMLLRMQAIARAEGGSSGSESDPSSSDDEQQQPIVFHQQPVIPSQPQSHPQLLDMYPRMHQSFNTYAIPQYPSTFQQQPQNTQYATETPSSTRMDVEAYTPSLAEFSTETETEFGTEFSFDEYLVDTED
ncbi:UNVERIFIED_CONTAM: hypothetical protein HDU68_002045 [Siphonaria sp. JEL0065]|nr:hypothetical protein HDU68_002045 [Siphonaria sp. JEL0065]